MLASKVLPPDEHWLADGTSSSPSTSEDEVLLLLLPPELASDGELGMKGSKRAGVGDDKGDELSGRDASANRFRVRE